MLKKIIFFALFLSFSCFAPMASGQFSAEPLDRKLKETFRRYELVKIAPRESLREVRQNSRLNIAFNNQTLTLKLQERDLLAPNYRAEETTAEGLRPVRTRPAVQTYRGTVAGAIESNVRLTVSETTVEGFINLEGRRFYIEPARRYSTVSAADEFVVYEEKDIVKTSAVSCGLPDKIESAAKEFGIFDDALVNTGLKVAELATDGDFEFVNATGGTANANQEILSIVNMVEGKYEQELGLTFTVTFQHTWTTPDPYNPAVRPANLPMNVPTTAANNMLGWFQLTWNNNFPTSQYPRDFAHLFSAKQAVFGRGAAFEGVICSNAGASYGMHSWVNSAPEKFLLASHEFGHTFGARHVDGIAGCEATIMLANLRFDTNFTFCQFSRSQIAGYLATGNNGSCLSAQLGKTKYDFDGDRKADVTVYRPSSGAWFTLQSTTGGATGVSFGAPDDRIVPEDYDGDGKTDVAVYRPSGGNWFILLSATNTIAGTAFGAPDDIPVPADLTGDDKAEIVVFRPSSGIWYGLNLQNGGFSATNFGQNGDVPLPNDFDADNKADIAVYRPSNGTWYVLLSTGGVYSVFFGAPTDRVVPADYDGDSKTDVAVYRPSNGFWYVLQSSNNVISSTAFGAPTDTPAPADFDGDSKADVNVYRPTGGNWFRLNSGNGAFAATLFGANGDTPAPAAYVR
jgi:hypothetical protein